VAPEEVATPHPTMFKDELYSVMTDSYQEKKRQYLEGLSKQISEECQTACPEMMTLMQTDLAMAVFVPEHWTGIRMDPVHIRFRSDMPTEMIATYRPVRPDLRVRCDNELT
jgi:hypothetical protein